MALLLYRAGEMPKERYNQHCSGVFRKVRYLDLFKRLPFPDDSFQYVFSSHVFEHLPRASLMRLLKELRRVIRPGGTMRVSVPDLTIMVKSYREEDGERVGSEKPIVGLCGFCFSTLYPAEGFPVVLLEAIVFRLSVVSTKWRGIPEIVDAGETGLLVETGVDRFEADRVAAELAEYLEAVAE